MTKINKIQNDRKSNESVAENKNLSARKKRILEAVINDYISTAEPVGSKSLVKNYNFNVSSAIVRNEMSELEEWGYLEKPHTSAGRIPSDLGYRTYVDEIMKVKQLPKREQEVIERYFKDDLTEIAALIKSSADILSEQTSFPTLVLSPRYADTSLQQIKILMIEPGKALVIVVLSPGIVKDRLIRIPAEIDNQSLMQVAGAIEEGLSGKRLDEITMITVTGAVAKSTVPEPLLNQVLYEAYVSIKKAENIDMYMEGSHNLLKHPEFSDAKIAHRIIDKIKSEGFIAGYIKELQPDFANGKLMHTEMYDNENNEHLPIPFYNPKYMVRIGQEIVLEGFEDCSFITTTYSLTDNIRGQISVIGPKRMAYNKIISQINFVNKKLTDSIRNLAVGEDKQEDRHE